MRALVSPVVLLALVVAVTAQWGGAFFKNEQAHGMNGQGPGGGKFEGFQQGGGGPGGQQQARPSFGGAGNDEYTDQWMPTARKGFVVPEHVKKMMDGAKNFKTNSKAQFRGGDGFVNKPFSQNQEDSADDDDEEEESFIPKSSPGKKGEGKTMDKCLKKVAHFCSMRVMMENFAAFNDCVYLVRYRISSECLQWAEGHGGCAEDMGKHCAKMSPADTTECLKKNKRQLSTRCVDSPFFVSMEQGFKEFRQGMKEGLRGNPPGERRYNGPQTPEDDEEESGGEGGDKSNGNGETRKDEVPTQKDERQKSESGNDFVRIRPKKVYDEREEL